MEDAAAFDVVRRLLGSGLGMPYAELERQFADIAGAAELERVRATFGSFLSFLLFASEHGDATPIRLRQVDGATLVYTLAPALGAAGSSPSLGVAPCVCRWLATQPNATLPELERWMRTEPMLWSRLVEDFGSVASFVSAAPRELYAMASALVLGAGRSRERIILQGDSVLGRVLFGTSLGEAAHATTAGAAARDTAAVLEDAFLEALAPALRQAVAALGSVVCAVQLDVGRSAGAVCCAPASTIVRLPVDVTPQHLQFTLDRTTQSSTTCHDTTFVASGDALHRCGLLRDAGNNGHVVGLTLTRGAMRVSLPANVPPTFVSHMASGSVLLMGRAGCGKTTLLRYWAARAAAPGDVSVMVLDTYNEIAGDETVPHASLGLARRLALHGQRAAQVAAIAAAVKHHGAQLLIIDDLSTADEFAACEVAVRRGCRVIAGCAAWTCDEIPASIAAFTHVYRMLNATQIELALD